MEILVQYVIPALVVTCIPLMLMAFKALYAKWSAETKNSKSKGLAARLMFVADLVVSDLNATMKADILAAAADGKISPDEAENLKNEAIDRLKELLKDHGFQEIKEVFGILLPSIETFLSGLVEKTVQTAKTPASPQ